MWLGVMEGEIPAFHPFWITIWHGSRVSHDSQYVEASTFRLAEDCSFFGQSRNYLYSDPGLLSGDYSFGTYKTLFW